MEPPYPVTDSMLLTGTLLDTSTPRAQTLSAQSNSSRDLETGLALALELELPPP